MNDPGDDQLERCLVDGCPNPARPGKKLCEAHFKRQTRGVELERPVRVYGSSRWSRLVDAAVELANAPDGDRQAFRTACARLRIAALRYASKRR